MPYTPDLNADFIYRGTYDCVGERGNLKDARCEVKYGHVFAIDMHPGMIAPPVRAFVYDVVDESDALTALYQAAELMGPPKDDNRINLFTELYQDCDGPGCWCYEHYGELPLMVNGKRYHKAEEGPIGIAKVTERKHLHDAGQSKIRRKRK